MTVSIDDFFDDNILIQACYEKAKNITIGSAILVKNQEKKIINSILSAETIAEKIIVCDTGSTDNTVKTIKNLRNYDKSLYLEYLSWEENFAKMRNLSTANLKTDWIFIIDSDEVITSTIDISSLKFCLAFLEAIIPSDEIVLCFKQEASGITGSGFPQRLYKNVSALKFWGFVHEELRSPNKFEIRTRFTLFNQGTEKEERTKFNKEQRYNQLLLKNIEIEPDNVKWTSLLSPSWILEHIDISYKMFNTLIKKFKTEKNEVNFFSMKLFMSYILILIQMKKDREVITAEIEFAKNIFSHNPIFYYYDYFLKINDINNDTVNNYV